MSARSLLVLSWTKVHLLRTCPLAWRRRYIDHAPELASMPAETGISFHDVAAELEASTAPGSSLDEGLVLRLLTRKAATLAEPAANDLRFLVALLMKRGGLPGFPSDVQDRSYERRIAVGADGKVCSWDDPAALFRGIFDQAWRENGGTLAVIGDWKTGRVTDAPGDQLRFYGWAASCLWPEVTEVVGRNYWLRYSARPDPVIFDASDLRQGVPATLWAIREELERRLRDNDWKPRVTDFCRTCSFMPSCAAFRSGMSPFRTIDSVEAARSAAEALSVLKGQVAMTEKALRAFVAENGAVDLSETEEFGPRPQKSLTVREPRLFARVVRERGVPDDVVWEHLRVAKSGVSNLLWAACSHSDQREALTAELLSAGVLTEKTTTGGIRRRKKLPPEIEALDDGEEDEL